MRMNRENIQSPLYKVKKHCANYNTGYKCSGIMIDKNLNQCVDDTLSGKTCLIKKGEQCSYFKNIVEPSIQGEK